MSNNVVEILRSVVSELREITKSETVIGDPVTVGDKTVIPVIKVSVGFGVGGGEGKQEKGNTGFGGGGGGGAKIEPAAFIIISGDDIKLLPAGKGKWDSIIDAVPGIAKKISKLVDDLKSNKGDNKAGKKHGKSSPDESDKKKSDDE